MDEGADATLDRDGFTPAASGAYAPTDVRRRARKVLGPDHPDTANTVLGMAEVALEQQRFADAVTLAERAVAILSSTELRPVELATAQFVLARALALTDGDRARAVALAQTARAAFEQVRRDSERAVEIDAWLREQGKL